MMPDMAASPAIGDGDGAARPVVRDVSDSAGLKQHDGASRSQRQHDQQQYPVPAPPPPPASNPTVGTDTTTTTITLPRSTRPRTATTTAEIEDTISHPGAVRINVKGAFIVDDGSATPATPAPDGARSGSPDHHPTQGIRLPYHTAVVSHIAIDIGGSLAKLVYFSREPDSTEPGGRLNFTSFETDRIDDCVAFMRHLRDKQQPLNGSKPGSLCVMATGGGAYKYYDKIRAALGVDVHREDEMECLIIGLDFFITEIPREVFTYSETEPMHFVAPAAGGNDDRETSADPAHGGSNGDGGGDDGSLYPYLLVNIGSGVSFLKVEGPRRYQRVGGTSLGGGTLWGLLSLLTGAATFDEMLDMASRGDNSRVDMLVGDIYGTDYGKIGLKSSTIASSFGKVFRMKREAEAAAEDTGGGPSELENERMAAKAAKAAAAAGATTATSPEEGSSPHANGPGSFSKADMSRSLLYAISNNIGQIAYLQSQIHNLSAIYFGGSFIRGHPQTMNTLSYAIRFWSKGASQAYFLRHEGYLGAVGAFLKRQPRNWGRRGSFEELRPSAVERRMRQRGEPSPPPRPANEMAAAEVEKV
ncbi:hypothetical protein MAPG_02345 [Magnaporthiopsis poae ATCC 64411]|uniref:Pantothenate kinase n=1 Tax=Magnaporthiopsis poae (strain ATCC 64411 / 73-15) TaxID=644358 RepID=A0A0C4DR44_MAGP6|nr:hypothetical protein MAPG_02345 [Magnaporthiopsis poae ATCC 64411]